jgi:hypothetical protein
MKKLLLSLLSVVVSYGCFASTTVDLGSSAKYTPYDRYMGAVKQVLTHLNGTATPTMPQVRQWMSQGRNFRYSFTDPYVAATPDVTARLHAGDCKAKSLWLADQINDPSVRFVIGKARSSSRISHAWLMWKNEGRWWILDCTNTREPIAADRINPEREYIPLYSYSKTGNFCHSSTGMMANAGTSNRIIASR